MKMHQLEELILLAKILNKFFHFNIGKSLLIVDFVVTLLGAITFGIDIGLYSIISCNSKWIYIDKVIDGFNVVKKL